jgi:hypothetical protein
VKDVLTAVAVLFGVAFVAPPADALWINLRPDQISQAVAYGRAGKDVPSETFEREWRVRAVGGGGIATVDSEFLVVARAARELARRGNPDRMNLPETMCAFLAGPALYVAVTLEVPQDQERAPIEARLEAGREVVVPLDVWPWQLVDRDRARGSAGAVRVSHYLKFPIDRIAPGSRVTVVTLGPGGRAWRFLLDLKTMR